MTDTVAIRSLSTGVPGLDEVLGGGLPEFSFNLIAGGPGCGKTTLMHQLAFANASADRPAVYFTVLGEPPMKMLRYQQQYRFFDAAKLDGRIRFLHLGDQLLEGGLERVLQAIIAEVDASHPSLVIVDSFRSALDEGVEGRPASERELQKFLQRLALHLTTREATTFLVGEYLERETDTNPLFTIADGILWMYQTVNRNSVVRQVQVRKLRGHKEVPGLHTFQMSAEGVRVFPRLPLPPESTAVAPPERRLSTGVGELDVMLGGGIPQGYSVLIAGPSGSGKTVLATRFILEGIAAGERGVIVVFEKRPSEYLRTTPTGAAVERATREGTLGIVYLRPLDLSVEETMEAIRLEVVRLGAKRVVLDSLSGFELALAPPFQEDFRESLYRMVAGLTALGVTVLMTVEVADSYTELRLSPHGISFLSDCIVLQRYVELGGQLRRVLTVVKLRANTHSKELREYDVTADGLVIGRTLHQYSGLFSGKPSAAPATADGPSQG